ncbi:MAG: polymer-forming cytoskeletal protein [Deltaproteobacteria bacterium]|nr:polymer-forming cytoskeletal protein [Deltaproteobacteria bacterium]MCD6137757.1 polymer-forming cytoskeletal protein [Deltaproteobacteria bacterium]RLB92131.1 MAG: hypothetical protein DRH10_00185 [Deltaproteobacteria bacterium]RLB93338.1 MAG: hypothetical protein DRH50_08135 [Deltaproteobacteria bacterium]
MKRSNKGIQTFLGEQTTLEGRLAFEGAVRLDGHFRGTIESKEGLMIVGEKGVINADISVHTATVSGEVSGNIHATNRIELHAPARVFGDLAAPVVVIDAGVLFQGNCTMKPDENVGTKTIKLAEWQT